MATEYLDKDKLKQVLSLLKTEINKTEEALRDEIGKNSGKKEIVVVDINKMLTEQDLDLYNDLSTRCLNGDIILLAQLDGAVGVISAVMPDGYGSYLWTTVIAIPEVCVAILWYGYNADYDFDVLQIEMSTLTELIDKRFPLPSGKAEILLKSTVDSYLSPVYIREIMHSGLSYFNYQSNLGSPLSDPNWTTDEQEAACGTIGAVNKNYVVNKLAENTKYVDDKIAESKKYVDDKIAESKNYIDGKIDKVDTTYCVKTNDTKTRTMMGSLTFSTEGLSEFDGTEITYASVEVSSGDKALRLLCNGLLCLQNLYEPTKYCAGRIDLDYGRWVLTLPKKTGTFALVSDIKSELVSPSVTWTASEQTAACKTIGIDNLPDHLELTAEQKAKWKTWLQDILAYEGE